MQRRTDKHRAEVETKSNGGPAHSIRIASEAHQEQALVAFRLVREAVHSIGEDEFLVTAEHLAVLRKEGIPFQDLTGNVGKDGKAEAG